MTLDLLSLVTELPAANGGADVPVTLSITYDDDDAGGGVDKTVTFAMKANGKSKSFPVPVTGPKIPGASATLERGVLTIDVDLNDPATPEAFNDAGQRFTNVGLLGSRFAASARLSSVRLVARARGQNGDWTGEAPSFEMHLGWALGGKNKTKFTDTEGNEVDVNAKFEAEVCTAMALISPDWPGLSNLEFRIDTPSIGLSTGWVPLGLLSALPELRLDVMVAWFAALILDVDLPDWPDFDLSDWGIMKPDLPKWDLDLPANLDLPLGLAVKDTRLQVKWTEKDEVKGLEILAEAKDFYLTWRGEAVTDTGGRLSLSYSDDGYVLEADLYSRQWPKKGEKTDDLFRFALPFDLLSMEAEAWFLSLGLRLEASTIGGPPRICFQALLEIGGLIVRSGLASGSLYKTDLRLLILDRSVMSQDASSKNIRFFAKAEADGTAFERWMDPSIPPIPAYSFARDLRAPVPMQTDPANDYGLTFLDGKFRRGERAFLLWQMNGERLVRALGHDILGNQPAGAIGKDEAKTTYALEWLQDPGGAWQVRLDWRGNTPDSSFVDASAPKQLQAKDGCFNLEDIKDDPTVSLPVNAPHAVALDGRFDSAWSVSLPGVQIEAARPADQGLVLNVDASGDWSVSHLLLFAKPPTLVEAGGASMPPPLAPVLRAKVGFATSGESGKSQYDTTPATGAASSADDATFLTLAAGWRSTGGFAIRSIGWRKGQAPRFLQVLSTRNGTPLSLVPANLPTPVGPLSCPGQPLPLPEPGLIRFDDFDSPDLEDWGLSIRVAADNALFRMFENGDASQKVGFRLKRICKVEGNPRLLRLEAELTASLAGEEDITGEVGFLFDLSDLSIRIDDEAQLTLNKPVAEGTPEWAKNVRLPKKAKDYLYSTEFTLAGLNISVLVEKPEKEPERIAVLALDMADGKFNLGLPKDALMILRFAIGGNEPKDGAGKGAEDDSSSLVFLCNRLTVGPGGLDIDASLLSDSVKLPGIESKTFALAKANLRMRGGRLDLLEVEGAGTLPAILDNAPVKIGIILGQEPGSKKIELRSLKAELGDKGKPIFSRGTRFRFQIDELDLVYRKEKQENARAWFEITGSASFNPDPGEFEGGIIGNLKSVTLSFTRLVVGDDSDLLKSLSLMVELDVPRSITLFGVFEMEIRSIGLHPAYPELPDRPAAILIGGHIRFADKGDVVQAKIDFNTLAICVPRKGSALPQVHAKGLRVEISSPEGFKIAGRVDSMEDLSIEGFAGEGTVQVPGLPELSAAFAFVQLRRDASQPWKRAWFVAIEAAKISYLVGGALPIYLRQVGLGFGYRYTLPLLAEFSKPGEPKAQIDAMLNALEKHQSLARIDSWQADPETNRDWTIALEGVLSLGTTQPTPFDYDARAERRMRTIFAQFLAAYRSDFTMVAATKIWFPVSIDDFFEDREGMRARPLAQGFIAYSAPQNRLLAHARKANNPYLGPKDEAPYPMALKAALDAIDYDVTLLVEPGLVHVELGWPDRLRFELSVGPLKVGCRGGILMRLEDDILIYGYYFNAYGELVLSGGVNAGVVGLTLEARVIVSYSTRLLIAADTRKPADSMLHGLIALDLAVKFAVRAWLRIKLKFVRITIRISFSFSLQISVLGEIGWAGKGELGFRGRATLSISVFGRSLGIRIDVGVNKSGVDTARQRLEKYATSILEPGKTPPFPGLGDIAVAKLPAPTFSSLAVAPPRLQPPVATAAADDQDDFVLALRHGQSDDTGQLHFVWIMPGPSSRKFYPIFPSATGPIKHATLKLPDLEGSAVFTLTENNIWTKYDGEEGVPLYARPEASVVPDPEPGEEPQDVLTLGQMVALGHVPIFAETEYGKSAKANFPSSWAEPKDQLTFHDAELTAPRVARLRDRRVFDPDSPARNLRRTLDPSDPWDKYFMLVAGPAGETPDVSDVGASEDESVDFTDAAALANQAVLLQALRDDLHQIARTTRWKSDAVSSKSLPETPALPTDRPTLFDLGLVLCIRTPAGKDLPDWVARRSATTPLEIMFESEQDFRQVRPAIDAAHLDFLNRSPKLLNVASIFDDENLALAWEMAWPDITGEDRHFAKDAGTEVDDYIESYLVEITDLASGAVLHRETSALCETRVVLPPDTSREFGEVALVPRFGFNIASSDVLRGRLGGLGPDTELIASFMPISGSGVPGPRFGVTLAYRPSRAPLPAEGATGRLTRTVDGKNWRLLLDWTQPLLPEDGMAAATKHWVLVLRPLDQVPPGAYPEATDEPSDRGRMGATALALQPGDVQLVLTGLSQTTGVKIYELVPDPVPDNENTSVKFFDSEGKNLLPDDPRHIAAIGFLRGTSAAQMGGYGWRFFLRSSASEDTVSLAGARMSGLSAVTLLLDLADRSPRPLTHFEWPDRLEADLPRQVDAQDLAASAGTILVPKAVWNAGSPKGFTFVKPPRIDDVESRGASLTWNLLPSSGIGTGKLRPEAVAAFTVHEWRLDDLVNRDLPAPPAAGGTSVGTVAATPSLFQVIRRVVPVTALRAREVPQSMFDTQMWDAQYPGSPEPDDLEPEILHLRWPRWSVEDQGDNRSIALEKGQTLARRPVHPGLARLLGLMAEQEGTWRFEVLDGPPPPFSDPFAWLAAGTEAADPYGWASLSTLGLSAVILARDRVTGELADQDMLIDLVQNAALTAEAEKVDKVLARHLMLELPVQPAQAYRTDATIAGFRTAGLGMIRLSLRPMVVQESQQQASDMKVWIDLVSRAFARAAPGAEDVAQSIKNDIEAVAARLGSDKKRLDDLYKAWARRFWRSRHGAVSGTGDDLTLAGRLAAAYLRTPEPFLASADPAGRLRFTHPIDEQWATARRYAVTREGRYDRLLGEDAAIPLAGNAVDVALDRIRKLEPPTVMHLGLWQGSDGRRFHDIIVSHSERQLSDRNRSVQGRLAFGEIARSYDRVYPGSAWVKILRGQNSSGRVDLLAGVELAGAPTKRNTTDETETHPVSIDPILADAPQARWNALRYRDAAEPFYYLQRVTLLATAGICEPAALAPIVLPQQPADDLAPLGPDETMAWVNVSALAFPSPIVPGFLWEKKDADERVQRANVWAVSLGGAPELTAWFETDLYDLELRLPRYVESLSPKRRETWFPHEMETYSSGGRRFAPAGLLPDDEARCLLIGRDALAGTVEPLVQVTPAAPSTLQEGAALPPAFKVEAVSPRVHMDDARVSAKTGKTWADGLWVKGTMRSISPQAFRPSELEDLFEITEITEKDKGPDETYAWQFPPLGPILCLTPLALRLVVRPMEGENRNWVGLLIPPAAPIRGILRPHLWQSRGKLDPTPGDETDLAIALRLLLDIARRRILHMAVTSEALNGARSLMREIEEAELVFRLGAGNDPTKTFNSNSVTDWAANGLKIWDMSGSVKLPLSETGNTPPVNGSLIGTLSQFGLPGATIAKSLDSFREFLDDDPLKHLVQKPYDPKWSVEKTVLARQIAAGAFRSSGLKRPEAQVLRGNRGPQRWNSVASADQNLPAGDAG